MPPHVARFRRGDRLGRGRALPDPLRARTSARRGGTRRRAGPGQASQRVAQASACRKTSYRRPQGLGRCLFEAAKGARARATLRSTGESSTELFRDKKSTPIPRLMVKMVDTRGSYTIGVNSKITKRTGKGMETMAERLSRPKRKAPGCQSAVWEHVIAGTAISGPSEQPLFVLH